MGTEGMGGGSPLLWWLPAPPLVCSHEVVLSAGVSMQSVQDLV